MKYVTMIFDAIRAISKMADLIGNYLATRKRTQEVKKIESLKKETQKNIKDTNIDKINENLQF